VRRLQTISLSVSEGILFNFTSSGVITSVRTPPDHRK
jgi:hypothetical protein